MFAYCLNNPINKSDPSGEFSLTGVGIFISAAIGGIVSAAGTAASGGSVAEIAVSFGIGALSAGATAAVAAISTISVGTAALCSAGIGFVGEAVSQIADCCFHYKDEGYHFDSVSSFTKLAYASGMGALGGYVATGINQIFAGADEIGLFVSTVASTSLGGMDFGIRQIISAVTTPESSPKSSNQSSVSGRTPMKSLPRNSAALLM